MRLRKPYLKDTLPTQLCVLCNRYYCVDHKGIEDGVCEINHATYYEKHPALRNHIYRTYGAWEVCHKHVTTEEGLNVTKETESVETKEREPLDGTRISSK